MTEFAAFLVLAAAVVVIPGPATTLVMKNAVVRGFGSAVVTAGGVLVADLVWMLAAFGVTFALAGVDVAIAEPRRTQQLEGSRARGLHARTIEVLDQRGIAELAVPAHRGRRVTGLVQDDDGVDVQVGDGPPLRARYLVGCDGGRSVVPRTRLAGMVSGLFIHLVDARHEGAWELPVLGPVTAPAAVLIRPDGHVAWVGDGTDEGLAAALGTWA